MFVELMPLVADRTVLITVSRIDEQTIQVNVVPRQVKDGENAALTTPLCLTGTPAEIDAEFPRALETFTTGHRALRDAIQESAALMESAAKEVRDAARKKADATKAGAAKAGAAKAGAKPTAGATTAAATPTRPVPTMRETAPAASGKSPAAGKRTTTKPATTPVTKTATKPVSKTAAPAAKRSLKPLAKKPMPESRPVSPKAAVTVAPTPAINTTAVAPGEHAVTPTTTPSAASDVSDEAAPIPAQDVATFTATLDRLHRDSGLTIETIATRLGYQHTSSLYKALRRQRISRKIFDAMMTLAQATPATAPATASATLTTGGTH